MEDQTDGGDQTDGRDAGSKYAVTRLRTSEWNRPCLYRVIYRWKALDLSFSMNMDQFAYLSCSFSRRPWMEDQTDGGLN